MTWPVAAQFSAVLQNPAIAFRDPELKRYEIERDQFRQPRPRAGAFAVVYRGTPSGGGPPRAIRVFTTASPERRERYDLISRYLESRSPGCLVRFEYREESVRASGADGWYPLILMDWVEGDTLFKWAKLRCAEGNRLALGKAAARWVDVVTELEESKIAHGDLQHGNVMVTPDGQIKLVDYDGMCVPALVGRRNLEVGVKPYQHPQRNETTLLSLELDRFSSMFIYVALKALSYDPGLWERYVVQCENDKLLFREQDFDFPEQSPLFNELKLARDEDLADAAEQLQSLIRVPMDRLPPLRELVKPSWTRIRRALDRNDYAAVVALCDRRGGSREAPKEIKGRIEEAYLGAYRQQAWKEFKKISAEVNETNDRKLTAAWHEGFFRGFPEAEKERKRVEYAVQRLEQLERLAAVVARVGSSVTLAGEQELVEASGPPLPLNYEHQNSARVAAARQRVKALECLTGALAEPQREHAIVNAWQEVRKAKCEAMVGDSQKKRIQLALQRVPLLAELHKLSKSLPLDELDQRLLEIWNPEVLDRCAEAAPWLALYHEAFDRREGRNLLETAIANRDDHEIVRWSDQSYWRNYPLPEHWKKAIQAAKERIARTARLLQALQNNDVHTFCKAFDAALIQQHQQQFGPHEDRLCEWTRRHVLSTQRIGLLHDPVRASLLLESTDDDISYRARWTWPQRRYCQECILAVCAREPRPGEDPRELPVYHRVLIDRNRWEVGSGSIVFHAQAEWGEAVVAVWAIIDLGFRTLPSHPLVIGHLQPPKRGIFGRLLGLFKGKPAPPSMGQDMEVPAPAPEPWEVRQ